MSRGSYETELQDVKNTLLSMGEKVEIAIDQSIRSLKELDENMARRIVEKDIEIDHMELDVEKEVTRLIATQQPVAKDLRKLTGALYIASDLERMGDLASNIAEVTLYFITNHLKVFKPLEDIPTMAKVTQEMVHDGINSYIDENVMLAKDMAKVDDKVDKMYEELVKDIISFIVSSKGSTDEGIRLTFVGRYLERISDHATNIGERVVYIVEAEHADLN